MEKIKENLHLYYYSSVDLMGKEKMISEYLSILNSILSDFLFKKGPSFIPLKKKFHYGFTVNLCGKAKIKTLNHQYRSKKRPTDVLSFPLNSSVRTGGIDYFHQSLEIELGDIFICKEVALAQAKEYSIEFEEEVIQLLIHGFLHLLGFDHEISVKEEKLMFDLEAKIFLKFKALYKKVKLEKK
jgi:probable rRNA maturation factor